MFLLYYHMIQIKPLWFHFHGQDLNTYALQIMNTIFSAPTQVESIQV